jgi:hypothetical protein
MKIYKIDWMNNHKIKPNIHIKYKLKNLLKMTTYQNYHFKITASHETFDMHFAMNTQKYVFINFLKTYLNNNYQIQGFELIIAGQKNNENEPPICLNENENMFICELFKGNTFYIRPLSRY